MGIPSYFSHLVRNYKGVLKAIEDVDHVVDNLYLDSNSIIYDCVRTIETDADAARFQDKLISAVCAKLQEYIEGINPRNVIVAFDGVAPVAKLEQQRTRRYRGWFEQQVMHKIGEGHDSTWCTAAITPGTRFMSDLADGVNAYFQANAGGRNIMVSSSQVAGEGEHKIFEYIRDNAEEHKNATTVIYGLDADLIMLTLNHLHISKKLLLFRETPHFIRHLDKGLNPETLYCLDIPSLAYAINEELVGDVGKGSYDVHRVHDYILLCFLLGNDFMPHFPSLNIRTTGVDNVMAAYRSTLGAERASYITDGEDIQWRNVRKVIKRLAEQEKGFLRDEYNLRRKWQKKATQPHVKMEKDALFQSLPVAHREQELALGLDQNDEYWKDRYYKILFHCENNEARVKSICIKYLEAMEWTYVYYRKGCKDWRWCYPYNFAPLLCDLLRYVPHFKTQMLVAQPKCPIRPMTQLCYVLPAPYHNLLPNEAQKVLKASYSHCYRTDWNIQWAFCKYFWESHVDMEPIDIERLERDICAKVLKA